MTITGNTTNAALASFDSQAAADLKLIAKFATEKGKPFYNQQLAFDVRAALARAVDDQAILAKIAETAPEHGLRHRAISRLEDQDVLARLAGTDPDRGIRLATTERLADQATLATIAKTDADFFVRAAAARRLNPAEHAELLAEILIHDLAWPVRQAAAETIADVALLARVALEDQEANVRQVAVRRMPSDLAIFERITRLDGAQFVRDAAEARLRKSAYLAGVACPHCGKMGYPDLSVFPASEPPSAILA